jgi:hypothetical protein
MQLFFHLSGSAQSGGERTTRFQFDDVAIVRVAAVDKLVLTFNNYLVSY